MDKKDRTPSSEPAVYLVNAANKMNEMLEESEKIPNDLRRVAQSLGIAAREGCAALRRYIEDVDHGPPKPNLILSDEYLQERALRFVLAEDSESFFNAERQILERANVASGVIEKLIKWCREGLDEVRAGKISPSDLADALHALRAETCSAAERLDKKFQDDLNRDLNFAQSQGSLVLPPTHPAREQLRADSKSLKSVFKGIAGLSLRAVNGGLTLTAPVAGAGTAATLSVITAIPVPDEWAEVILAAVGSASKPFGEWIVRTWRRLTKGDR